MPCLEDDDQSLNLAPKDFEPDEDVFESEIGTDSELEDMKRLGTGKESLRKSGQSMFSNTPKEK